MGQSYTRSTSITPSAATEGAQRKAKRPGGASRLWAAPRGPAYEATSVIIAAVRYSSGSRPASAVHYTSLGLSRHESHCRGEARSLPPGRILTVGSFHDLSLLWHRRSLCGLTRSCSGDAHPWTIGGMQGTLLVLIRGKRVAHRSLCFLRSSSPCAHGLGSHFSTLYM